MPGLIEVLGEGAGAAYPFLRSAIAEGQSVGEFLRIYRAAGSRIRTQTAYDLASAIKPSASLSTYANNPRLWDVTLPPELHTTTPVRTKKAYSYSISTNTENPFLPHGINISSDTPYTVNEIYAKATQALKGQSFDAEVNASLDKLTLTLEDATYSPRAGQ